MVNRFTKFFLILVTAAAFGFNSDASAYWQVTYDLIGTQQQVTNTPLMAGDAVVPVGPGTLVLEFHGAPDGATPIATGDAVVLSRFELMEDFTISSPISDIRTVNVMELGRPVGGLTDAVWGAGTTYPDGTFVQADGFGPVGSATGSWDGSQVNWSTPATNWTGFGVTTCAGNAFLCAMGGWPDGSGNIPRVDDVNQDLPLVAFLLADPMVAGSSLSAIPMLLSSSTEATAYLLMTGSVTSVEFIPEPGTALLLGSGLIGLATMGRRQKA